MNRIKVELAERDMKHNDLAERLGKEANTVTRWCNNVSQPNIKTLFEIALILGCEASELIRPMKDVYKTQANDETLRTK